MENKYKRILQLDSLRFFMMIVIFLSHLEFWGNSAIGQIYLRFLHNSVFAVDYFFLLSGFGLYYSNCDKEKICNLWKCLKFAIKKIKRLYPVYIFSLLIDLPYAINTYYEGSGNYLNLIIKSVFEIFMFQSLTGMTAFSHAINGAAWFISTIFWCYVVSPYLIQFLKKYLNNIKKLIISMLFTMLLILILSVIFNIVEKKTIFDDLFYGSPYIRVLYVFLGMLVAKAYMISSIKIKKTTITVSCIIISFVYFLCRNTLANYASLVVLRFLDCVTVTAFLFIMTKSENSISKVLRNNYLVNLGNGVMYFYLVHYPIRNCISLIYSYFELSNTVINYLLESFLILLISIIISIVFNYLQKCMKNEIVNR